MPAAFPKGFEVRVFDTSAGPRLVAAIELVSPGNKDRPEVRRAFAVKCASYLYHGIGLIVVDVVTERRANLHNETMSIMEAAEAFRTKRMTPIELVDELLGAIAGLNPKLNAYLTVTAESARREAAQATTALARGEALGPLHGIPLALKDLK